MFHSAKNVAGKIDERPVVVPVLGWMSYMMSVLSFRAQHL